jgi:di/tricarboxylate transporter
MRFLLALVAGAALALALLGGLDEDTAAQLAAERTERTQIEQTERTQRTAIQEAERTERTYITAHQIMWLATERESTLRLIVVLLIVVVASTAAVIVAVQVLRQRPPTVAGLPQPPASVRRVAARMPAGHRLEYDPADGWVIVLPGDREYYTIEDARRLLNG